MNIREKILVIEDEKSIAHFISTILTANGYDAMRASSGAEAMSMISSHCPDLVILIWACRIWTVWTSCVRSAAGLPCRWL